ncbi:hypothetical protein EK21DRAFT_108003 [Setomelanomma holmii]|uniref:Uncharacterized protein n=1 Tax=Setomelanomma holmii TaxID=210430 RepID=A0A9P4LNY0_9PLEO|nr:hypothetical protein EK21DRAFT_108003 [Setomelanomma holmii]
MFNLENDLMRQIRRIALYAYADDVNALLEPLQSHFRDIWNAEHRLKELRIILNTPYITDNNWREARIREENRASESVSELGNVEMAVVQNIFFRTNNAFNGNSWRPSLRRQWKVLDWEDDDERLSDDRWELIFEFQPGDLFSPTNCSHRASNSRSGA